MENKVKKIACLLWEHKWSDWYNLVYNNNYCYRWCKRCNMIEEKLLKEEKEHAIIKQPRTKIAIDLEDETTRSLPIKT